MENNLKNKHENMLWYIFLFSNVSILFGIVISWIITIRTEGINNYYILLIFNLISIILSAIFYFFETKEFVIKKFHVKEKWFKYFILSCVVYVFALLFSFIFQWIMTILLPSTNYFIEPNVFFSIEFSITMLITLVDIVLVTIVRVNIAKEIFLRNRGKTENDTNKTEENVDDSLKIKGNETNK